MKLVVPQALSDVSPSPLFFRNSLVSFGLILAVGMLFPFSQTPLGTRLPTLVPPAVSSIPQSDLAEGNKLEAESGETSLIQATLEYEIRRGDTLSRLFKRFNISQKAMYQVLESDLDILALDTLKPGNRLKFWLDDDNRQLNQLELYFNPARQVIFTRVDADSFSYREVIKPGEWRAEPIQGEIHGSFYLSAQKAGLTASEVQKIESLFKEKLNFSRDLRAGDRFEVLRNQQYIDEQLSGNSEILGIRLNGRHLLTAFLFEDGSYYDAQGKSLSRAFSRYPVSKRYRISSRFNPRRKHPVTGRTRPHNGTDFATPIGVPVLSTGDGVVKAVKNHPYAGKYVVIQHSGKYRSRYLHLSRTLVKPGQRVARDQRIGLSGKTGRVTGPHLHYEFHINRRPVDPMRANIPMATEVPAEKMLTFKQTVATFTQSMND